MSKHAVVRTDLMTGSMYGSPDLVSIKYMGTDGNTPTAIENGNVLKVGALVSGERNIYAGSAVAANTALADVVLVATPEVMYESYHRNLDEYTNEAGTVLRGYRLHSKSVFGITKEALSGTGTPAVGNIIELAAGTKLAFVSTLTSGSTSVGKIIAIENAGRDTFYVIEVQ